MYIHTYLALGGFKLLVQLTLCKAHAPAAAGLVAAAAAADATWRCAGVVFTVVIVVIVHVISQQHVHHGERTLRRHADALYGKG